MATTPRTPRTTPAAARKAAATPAAPAPAPAPAPATPATPAPAPAPATPAANYTQVLAAWAALLGGTVATPAARGWGGAAKVQVGSTLVSLYVSNGHMEIGAAGNRVLAPALAAAGLTAVHRSRTSYRVVAPANLCPATPAAPQA